MPTTTHDGSTPPAGRPRPLLLQKPSNAVRERQDEHEEKDDASQRRSRRTGSVTTAVSSSVGATAGGRDGSALTTTTTTTNHCVIDGHCPTAASIPRGGCVSSVSILGVLVAAFVLLLLLIVVVVRPTAATATRTTKLQQNPASTIHGTAGQKDRGGGGGGGPPPPPRGGVGAVAFVPAVHDDGPAGPDDRTGSSGVPTTEEEGALLLDVTFVGLDAIDWTLLDREMARFNSERHAALESLSFQLETVQLELAHDTTGSKAVIGALQSLADRIENKIRRLSSLYEQDQRVLRLILRPFLCSLALPPPAPTLDTNMSKSNRSTPRREDTATSGTDYCPTTASSSSDASALSVCRRRYVPNTASSESYSSSHATTANAAVYGTVTQVVAHLVRDWSVDGDHIRRSLYDWCVKQVHERAHEFVVESGADLSILVPGSGLGRLAYDLAESFVVGSPSVATDVRVHAIEPSLPMMASTAFLFEKQQQQKGEHGASEDLVLHPYASDPFTNEVDDDENDDNNNHEGFTTSFTSQRYRAVTIERPPFLRRHLGTSESKVGTTDATDDLSSPAAAAASTRTAAHLSFTVGDFASAVRAVPSRPYSPHPPPRGLDHENPGAYQFVITCFFLDTAPNVIEYVRLVTESLQYGGYWINVGPLQWHANAQLALTTRELRFLVEGMGYEIVSWSVDNIDDPVEYRSSSRRRSGQRRESTSTRTSTSSTRVEAYHPVRFVAHRRKRP